MKMQQRSLAALLIVAAVLAAPGSSAQPGLAYMQGDGDHLIFIVDTSGSMRRYEWDRVIAIVRETLAAYPSVRGMQVLNDEGDHLLESSRNAWLPDTPSIRQWIFDEIDNWEAFSTSNPRRGILTAIERYYDPTMKIDMFVLGDDLSAGSSGIDSILADIDARNSVRGDDGAPRVRIHGFAFPVFWDQTGTQGTGGDFASLMAAVSQRNGGRFVALPSRARPVAASTSSAADATPGGAAERRLIVVDASAEMAPDEWRRAIASVEWLLADVGGNQFQVMVLGEDARTLLPGTDGQWLRESDGRLRDQALDALRAVTPAGSADYGAVLAAAQAFTPAPDRIHLLAASDPDFGPESSLSLARGVAAAPPIELLLFAADSGREAVPHYWSLALASGGSLVAPAEDWP